MTEQRKKSGRLAARGAPSEADGTATQSSDDENQEKKPKRQKRSSTNGTPAAAITSPVRQSNPGASFAVLMSQAIQSGDQDRVAAIINRSDIQPSVISKTVEELPVLNILPFLQMVEKMMREESIVDARPWMNWLQVVLTTHASYLSSISDLDNKIGLLKEWMQRRMALRSEPVNFARSAPLTEFDA
uniref:Small-subunit processome Utp12 domain-containing protein n=1 Tax=Ditylenchus dipsaci TaxID=166011 RepID=A0A915DKE0_9BILA